MGNDRVSIQNISIVYNLTNNPVNGLIEYSRHVSVVTPTQYRLVYLMLVDNIFEQKSYRAILCQQVQ